jgi:glycosyltransferase involved in cell wall biosynthesis
MASGLPVVANPVGVQRLMVQAGRTGYLVETAGQWLAALNSLANEPDLRQQLGRAGRRRVEKAYSVPVGAALWLELLERLGTRQVRRA